MAAERPRRELTAAIGLVLAIALGLTLAACKNDNQSKGSKPAPEQATPTSPTKPTPAAEIPPASPEAIAAINGVMAAYETCRALLADDQVDGIADCAGKVAAAASAGEAAVPAAAKPSLEAIATAAVALGQAPAADVEVVRLAFGELSKPVVGLLAAVPAAAAKYHVFECPMAKGYKRWAQTDATKANPYMGKQMLQCGSEVKELTPG